MPPFVTQLLGKGLSLVANAAAVKGANFIRQKTGIDIESAVISNEDLTKLKQFELEHEEELLKIAVENRKIDLENMKILTEAAVQAEQNVTDRWREDMQSDSWLSKNIRPLALITILGAYFIFAAMSAFGLNANEAYVTLLGNWGMLVMGAYFGTRSVEKIFSMRKGVKT